MATYTSRVITSTRREWIVPASQPWGAPQAEVGKAWAAAELAYRSTSDISPEIPLHDDALRFHVTDDAVVISFTTEEPPPATRQGPPPQAVIPVVPLGAVSNPGATS